MKLRVQFQNAGDTEWTTVLEGIALVHDFDEETVEFIVERDNARYFITHDRQNYIVQVPEHEGMGTEDDIDVATDYIRNHS